MKKILMILLSLALVLSMAGAVAAADSAEGEDAGAGAGQTPEEETENPSATKGSGSSTVTIEIKDSYILSVPTTITLIENPTTYEVVSSAAKVELTSVRIGAGESCYVYATSQDWQVSTGTDTNKKSVSYKLYGETEGAIGTALTPENPTETTKVIVLTVSPTTGLTTATTSGSANIYAKLDGQIAYTGTYTDQLTFTVTKENPTQV